MIGAGISGIGAAHRMRTDFPDLGFVVLEAQDDRGGTWWTHRFPGVRSDSDLFTYGYRHKPWHGPAIASGDAILGYLDEVIAEDGLAPHIHYHHRVTALEWSSEDDRWTARVTRTDTGRHLQITADFLWMCQGFYDHDTPHIPHWPGRRHFEGTVVHPQHWPRDLDPTGSRVLVVGSGSTAATIVPALARQAEHVTMLQRSPSYWLPAPTVHELATLLEPLALPAEWTHEIMRRAYTQQLDLLADTSRTDPDSMHEFLIDTIRPLLPDDIDVATHFTPRYRPWQQRIAITPDGEFFTALREGTASVVTDTISEFTAEGVRVRSGEIVPADIVVTATGFDLAVFAGIPFTVDGEPVDFSTRVTWRGLMVSGIPNMAFTFGYFRHSWTLRVDLVNDVVARIFDRMQDRGTGVVTPTLRPQDADMPLLPWMPEENFNAGYVRRSQHAMFRQGDREPWTHMHEYSHDRTALPAADLDDGLQYR
ncbi:NAD(P)/FAD-dependent oxidoreductase [Pseudonocardia sp. ICBG1293]|uniref:flavin-containing monooxygenase n=1 Tax=Pseudonocardia sp. ICBG1293 TaxID=2844382 RepID=UPI001CCCB76E|nr:NAD(P)/FAD-dependent oxidoreductase [Pseudonocardia sp. ICBG1293]